MNKLTKKKELSKKAMKNEYMFLNIIYYGNLCKLKYNHSVVEFNTYIISFDLI